MNFPLKLIGKKLPYCSEDGNEDGVVVAHELEVVRLGGGLLQHLQLVGDGDEQLVGERHQRLGARLPPHHRLHLPARLDAPLQVVVAHAPHVQLHIGRHWRPRGHVLQTAKQKN